MLTFDELNDTYRPGFLSWLRDHHVRDTCPACDSPHYALGAYHWYGVQERAMYARICRQCGHVMLFDIVYEMDLALQTQQRPDAVDNLHSDR